MGFAGQAAIAAIEHESGNFAQRIIQRNPSAGGEVLVIQHRNTRGRIAHTLCGAGGRYRHPCGNRPRDQCNFQRLGTWGASLPVLLNGVECAALHADRARRHGYIAELESSLAIGPLEGAKMLAAEGDFNVRHRGSGAIANDPFYLEKRLFLGAPGRSAREQQRNERPCPGVSSRRQHRHHPMPGPPMIEPVRGQGC